LVQARVNHSAHMSAPALDRGWVTAEQALSLAGVGLGGRQWLGMNAATGKLAIATTANQDPCSTTGLVPLLGVDVWEHAYYLQYKNVRPDYLKAVWGVVNWKDVAARYAAAK